MSELPTGAQFRKVALTDDTQVEPRSAEPREFPLCAVLRFG